MADSPNGTRLTGVVGTITDSRNNIWRLNWAEHWPDGKRMVRNGIPDRRTSNVNSAIYWNLLLWVKTINKQNPDPGRWTTWDNRTLSWIDRGPVIIPPPARPPVPIVVVGQLTHDSAHVVWH